jgi:hypothetical protein
VFPALDTAKHTESKLLSQASFQHHHEVFGGSFTAGIIDKNLVPESSKSGGQSGSRSSTS